MGNRGAIGWSLQPTRGHPRVCVWAVWEWRRLFGSRQLGDPAHSSEARQLGQAQWHVRGNGLSCGRCRGRPSGNRIGCRLPEAHVGNGMTSALEALSPPVSTIGRLRALRPRRGGKPSSRRGAAQLQTPSMQPKRRKTSLVYCLHAQGRLQWTERRSESARENREMLDMQSSSDLSGQGSKKWQAPSLECNLRRSLQ